MMKPKLIRDNAKSCHIGEWSVLPEGINNDLLSPLNRTIQYVMLYGFEDTDVTGCGR